MTESLISPHGGELKTRLSLPARAEELRRSTKDMPAITLDPVEQCDLELLLGGAYSPLEGYCGRADCESIARDGRLADGSLWPLPIVLDVPPASAAGIEPGTEVGLREPEGVLLAVLHVEEVWEPDHEAEARALAGTGDPGHPGAAAWLAAGGRVRLAGRIEGAALPTHHDFRSLRYTPRELRNEFRRMGWRRIVAFHTDRPLHRADVERTTRTAREVGANLLIHAVVGVPVPGDLEHYAVVRSHEAVLERFSAYTTRLALLPLPRRHLGIREVVLQAIVRRNFGASHFMVDLDPERADGATGSPAETLRALREAGADLGIEPVPLPRLVYDESRDEFVDPEKAGPGARLLEMDRDEFRDRLVEGHEVPDWHGFAEVVEALRRIYPRRSRQGFTVFFTGLSGAGKSTVAKVLMARLLEMGGRAVSLLDGDIVRRNLSSELGFSKEHRDLNIRRIGFVASEISKNGGIALCAPIAPYDRTRREVREMVERSRGGFVLVHVSTPLGVCEDRDRKGLYAKARAGVIKEFTGVSDPYEEPTDADLSINTSELSPEQAAQEVLLHLQRVGYLRVAR